VNFLRFLIVFLFLTSTASALEFPTGGFQYSHTQAFRTKHTHRLFQKSSSDKKAIEAYRANGYACKRHNSSITDCSKVVVTNPNQIDFDSEKLSTFSPIFSNKILGVNELSRGDSVTIYEVIQSNSVNSFENQSYKAYDIAGSDFYVDLNIDKFTQARFKVIGSKVLTRVSFQKETLNKREHYLHGLTSYYIK